MPYFDSTDPTHTALIRNDHRTYSDLANIAAVVERDVINAYTRVPFVAQAYEQIFTDVTVTTPPGSFPIGDGRRFVMLRGFDADPTLADPYLVLALRDTIADQIEWRIAQQSVSPLEATRSVQREGTTVTMRSDAGNRFGPHWNARLRSFDITPVLGSF